MRLSSYFIRYFARYFAVPAQVRYCTVPNIWARYRYSTVPSFPKGDGTDLSHKAISSFSYGTQYCSCTQVRYWVLVFSSTPISGTVLVPQVRYQYRICCCVATTSVMNHVTHIFLKLSIVSVDSNIRCYQSSKFLRLNNFLHPNNPICISTLDMVLKK